MTNIQRHEKEIEETKQLLKTATSSMRKRDLRKHLRRLESEKKEFNKWQQAR